MKHVVIIPGYNESGYVDTLLRSVLEFTPNIVFIDDGSSDDTYERASQHAVHVLRHEVNLGKGAALKTGTEYAFQELKADSVVFMDADMQHDPQELVHFWERLELGDDLVLGIRQLEKNMPWLRRTGNSIASTCFLLLFGKYIPDIPSGYKALSKQAYPYLAWNACGYEVEMEITIRAVREGVQVTQIPITTIYHDHDKGMTILDALRVLQFMVQERLEL